MKKLYNVYDLMLHRVEGKRIKKQIRGKQGENVIAPEAR